MGQYIGAPYRCYGEVANASKAHISVSQASLSPLAVAIALQISPADFSTRSPKIFLPI